MEEIDNDERWALQDNANEEEEEALSLSDLPQLIHNPRENNDDEEDKDHNIKRSPHSESQIQEQDFDFCSKFKESEMCAADDVFFQGSILPLRHSISSEHGLLQQHRKLSVCRSISSSETMDHSNYYSRSSLVSSRSSSINSNSSSSSSTSTVTTVPIKRCYKPKLQPRNQFHYYSHPSPSPRLRNRMQGGQLNRSTSISTTKKSLPSSSAWNIFKLGLVNTPPEILNTRPCPKNVKNFGSRNSASSNGSIDKKKKKKQRAGSFGSCKCTGSSVDEIRDSRIVVRAIIKRSASEGEEVKALFEDESSAEMMSEKVKKKQMSHHRTFQWLKQLSIEDASSEDHDRL